jgi:hypothetical protein
MSIAPAAASDAHLEFVLLFIDSPISDVRCVPLARPKSIEMGDLLFKISFRYIAVVADQRSRG